VDRRFGVLTLARRPDTILLWSHYADDHKGICIELDTARHPDLLPNLHPVGYALESPVISKGFANLLIALKDADKPALDKAVLLSIADPDVEGRWSDLDIRSWFLTKARPWAYEREWRSIKEGSGTLPIPDAAIAGVVIGCNAPPEVEEKVRAWVQGRPRKVRLRRAVKRRGAFALDLVPLG
jgi:hypothetical protein